MAVNDKPSVVTLWMQAGGYSTTFDRDRYRELLVEHGYLIPGKPEPLPCGWPGPQVEPPEQRAARQSTDAEKAAGIRARLASALERRLSDSGRTWSRYSTADPGATSRGWRWTTADDRSWEVSVDRNGKVVAGGPDFRLELPPMDGDTVALAVARLAAVGAFGAPPASVPEPLTKDDVIAHLKEQTLARKAKANRGQGDLVDEMPNQWRDG